MCVGAGGSLDGVVPVGEHFPTSPFIPPPTGDTWVVLFSLVGRDSRKQASKPVMCLPQKEASETQRAGL